MIVEVKKWEQFFELNKFFLSPFIFRGQQSELWELKTSIERAKPMSSFGWTIDYRTEEKWMLYEFMRRYHIYSSRIIVPGEKAEWLSVMQHHGCPTRLLDFTQSIFIATYFAVIESNTDASVWAINRHMVRDKIHSKHNLQYNSMETLKDEVNRYMTNFANEFIAKPFQINEIIPSGVIPLEPSLYTDRMARQQGLFLMPIDPNSSFMNNLYSTFEDNDPKYDEIKFEELVKLSNRSTTKNNVRIIKFILPQKTHINILEDLKAMNITAEILFPGLDGLAKSIMHTELRSLG